MGGSHYQPLLKKDLRRSTGSPENLNCYTWYTGEWISQYKMIYKKKNPLCRAVCRWVPCSRKRAELGLVNNRKQWLLDLTGEGVSTSGCSRCPVAARAPKCKLGSKDESLCIDSSLLWRPLQKKNGTKEQGQKISPDTTSAKMFVNTELAKRKAQPPLPSG